MACSSCNRSLISISQIPASLLECSYTKDMMIEWKNKLFCARDNNKLNITQTQFNSFIGIILSGINVEYNICYFKDKIAQIEPYISNLEEC